MGAKKKKRGYHKASGGQKTAARGARQGKGMPTEDAFGYLLLLAALCGGMYGTVGMSASAAVIGIWLLVKLFTQGIDLYVNGFLLPLTGIFLCAMATCLYGIDRGEALYGAIMGFVAVGITVLLMQTSEETIRGGLLSLPDIAVLLTVLSLPAALLPGLKSIVFPAGRLAGTFLYANTYALFLLLSFSVETFAGEHGEGETWKGYAYPPLLLFGILLTGSRTTALLAVVVWGIAMVRLPAKRLYYGAMGAFGAVAIVVWFFVTGDTGSLARLFTLSTRSSTLLGRLLYWRDGLSWVRTHPFGLGYGSYFEVQIAWQTGVYTVRYCHNDWLQCVIDYGVIAGVLLVVLAVFMVRYARSALARGLLLLIGAHMLMDFDLQYVLILLIALSCVNGKRGRMVTLYPGRGKSSRAAAFGGGVLSAGCGLFVMLSLWLGFAAVLLSLGAAELSYGVCPWSWEAAKHVLAETTDGILQERVADRLISADAPVGVAYEAKAACAARRGDDKEQLTALHEEVLLMPYHIEKYDALAAACDKVLVDASSAEDATSAEDADDTSADNDVAAYARACLAELPVILSDVKARTDPLAFQIKDKPELTLSEETRAIIKKWGK